MTAGENPQAMAPPEAVPGERQGWERLYHLDALRSILMVLGVFLHTSFLYAGGKPWLVKDDDSSRLLLWLNESIHFFRIPCFFILSGFFAQMLLKKQGKTLFLKSRMRRLALPMATTALLFNTLQAYLLYTAHSPSRGLASFATSAEFVKFWKSGEWVGHLWFLVNVLIYSLVSAGLWAAWKSIRPQVTRAWTRILVPYPFLARLLLRRGIFLLLLPLSHVLIFASAGFLPFLYWRWGGLSGYGLLHFFPYFFFGAVIFMDRRFRDEFHRLRFWQVLAIPSALFLGFYLHAHYKADWARAVISYLNSYLVWACCASLFMVFRFLLNRKIRFFTYLSEASYSIYLFHHVCVVGLGLYLAGKDWNVLLKFGVVVGVSLSVSLAVHHFLVLRIRVLRLLFMGK